MSQAPPSRRRLFLVEFRLLPPRKEARHVLAYAPWKGSRTLLEKRLHTFRGVWRGTPVKNAQGIDPVSLHGVLRT